MELFATRMAELSNDPLKWVLYSLPWGSGELKDYQGPEPWQAEILTLIGQGLMTYTQAIQAAVASGHGIGKAHGLETIGPTPSGAKRWGDLVPGDYLFDAEGKPTCVLQCHRFSTRYM